MNCNMLIPLLLVFLILYSFWKLLGSPKEIKINRFSKKDMDAANKEYREHEKSGRYN